MFSTLFCVNAVCHWFIKLLSDLIWFACKLKKWLKQILHVRIRCSRQLINDGIFMWFSDKKIIRISYAKNSQNDWLYASAATKNKDNAAKRLLSHKNDVHVKSIVVTLTVCRNCVPSDRFDVYRFRELRSNRWNLQLRLASVIKVAVGHYVKSLTSSYLSKTVSQGVWGAHYISDNNLSQGSVATHL